MINYGFNNDFYLLISCYSDFCEVSDKELRVRINFPELLQENFND